MSKLRAIFGGGRGGSEDAQATDSAANADAQAPAAPTAVTPQSPSSNFATFSSVDEYAATLPAPDYVDPAAPKPESAEAAA